jgi:transmembrane sensor
MNSDPIKPATPVAEQAAIWYFELAEGAPDRQRRSEFFRWLKRSPRHIEEFLAIAVLEQELSELPGELADILAEVRREEATTALPMPGAAEARREPPRRRWRRYAWTSAAAAASALLFFMFALDRSPVPVLHETDFGEQRSFALQDGSIVTLNTLSSLSVEFDASRRRVVLFEGQAMFNVAEDASQPFVVETGEIALSVLGTKFSVYRRPDSVEVAVVEGSVAASPLQSPHEQVIVTAGEGAIATAGGEIRRRQGIDVEKALAWTERRLIFDDAQLSEVVAEFNRYNRVPLVVEDRALARRTITTVFNAHDVSALVGFLELEPDIEVEYGGDAIRIRARD